MERAQQTGEEKEEQTYHNICQAVGFRLSSFAHTLTHTHTHTHTRRDKYGGEPTHTHAHTRPFSMAQSEGANRLLVVYGLSYTHVHTNTQMHTLDKNTAKCTQL